MTIGYHASHEQFGPSELLGLVKLAETAGFSAAMCSDHFHPWSERQGQSGFAWSWLGAALQATELPMGVITVPGWRYHPAVVAQGAATLAQMYPGRFWMALGSGEAINEHITGLPWPEKTERNARLRECVDIIRALLAGETVTHRGRVTVIDAKLYSRPATPPLLIGAAVTEATAEWLGGWADGLLTGDVAPVLLADDRNHSDISFADSFQIGDRLLDEWRGRRQHRLEQVGLNFEGRSRRGLGATLARQKPPSNREKGQTGGDDAEAMGEVPTSVTRPPISDPNAIGINSLDGAVPLRRAT